MGTREHYDVDDPSTEATVVELWGAGKLDGAAPGTVLTLTAVTGLLVALAIFFIAFAPAA